MSKAQLKRKTFKNNEFYLPVTVKQAEDLTNEMLAALNTLTGPPDEEGKVAAFSADYVFQILTNVLHGLPKKEGIANKMELFESCVNQICKHTTYHMTEVLQEKIKAIPNGEAPSPLVQPLEGDEVQSLANGQTAH